MDKKIDDNLTDIVDPILRGMASSEKELEAAISECFPKRPISRILLVNPPESTAEMFRYAAAMRGRNSNYPSYGLLILTKRLRAIGISVSVLNLNHEILKACHNTANDKEFLFDEIWQRRLDHELETFIPDIIGVTCMYTMTHNSFKRVCEYAARFGAAVVIGGLHVTNDVGRVMGDISGIRAAFIGEADLSFINFINVLNGRAPVSDLSQLILDTGCKRVQASRTNRPNEQEIDVIPSWDLSDVENAADYGIVGTFYYLKPAGTKFAPVLSSRGCRGQCTFCGVRNFNGKGVRQRRVESVLDELEILRNEYGIGHIMWLDDDLLKDKGRAIKLFNGMVKRNLDLTWDASNGVIASSCTEEVVSAMAASGCIAVNIGMETGNRETLKQIRKPASLDQFLQAAEVFRNYEQIYSNLLLILGFPGETMRMILNTIDVARQMDMDWYRISPLQPLPNTPLYDDMVNQGLIEDKGFQNSGDVRFAVGVFGTLTEIEQGTREAPPDFREVFSSISLDKIPSGEQITTIWFYMNYYLNFHRLLRETRPDKIDQQRKALRALADIISPDNAFALYFLAILEQRHCGSIDPAIIRRLESRLAKPGFWTDCFSAYGLSLEDIRDFESNSSGEKVDFKNIAK